MLDHLAWAPRAGSRPRRGLIHLRKEGIVPAPLEETFAFFSEASNLERLTPAWLNFRIRTPPPLQMREGLIIEYRLALYGVPVPWTTRIDVWDPGVRFVDRQLRGPYRWWRHDHRFEAVAGGTRVVDDLEFLPRVAWLTRGKVRRDVQRIFDYREQALRTIFLP